MEPIIRIEHLTHTYSAGTPFQRSAVEDVSLDIMPGEFLGIIGHTGSGKSTLIQHLNGLLRPTQGRILLDGKDIWAEPKKIRQVRFQVGLVFQYPEYQLFEESVEKDVAFGPKNLGLDERACIERAHEALRLVGLDPERFAQKSPFDLSGGEKRRAALAGILAMRPKYLVLDEPMAGLDPHGRRSILDMLERLRTDTGCTVIMISHSMDDVARHADRVAVMAHGRLVLLGAAQEVFSRADELTSLGLNVPQAAKLACLLRARGLDVPLEAVHPEQVTDWILTYGGWRA